MSDKDPAAFRTISEVADDLDLPQHVLRFWETKFSQIRPMKNSGGRRYYRPDDIVLLRAIREMLYGQGYTIRGVQRLLKEQGARSLVAGHVIAPAVSPATTMAGDASDASLPPAPVHLGAADDDASESARLRSSTDLRAIRDELRSCVRILRDAHA